MGAGGGGDSNRGQSSVFSRVQEKKHKNIPEKAKSDPNVVTLRQMVMDTPNFPHSC